jgi:Holliday junction DNA helicase RuvA
VHTFDQLGSEEEVKLFTHAVIREDAHTLYGFSDRSERGLFLALIGVSGVGASTARMVCSAMHPEDARLAIQSGNVEAMKGVKGIGSKTAQRIIVDLQDKLGTAQGAEAATGASGRAGTHVRNTSREDALVALTTLGFDRTRCGKVLDQILIESTSELALESLIKKALQLL